MAKRYIVDFRNKGTGYFEMHPTKHLLIKCTPEWKHIHITGWNVLNLSKMDYVKSIKEIGVAS